jgi:hypothetical protein
MPLATKLKRRALRVIGDTTIDRYLKTTAINKVVQELTPAAVLADIGAVAAIVSTDERIARFDGAEGALQDSLVKIDDAGVMTLGNDLDMNGRDLLLGDSGLTIQVISTSDRVMLLTNLGSGAVILGIAGKLDVSSTSFLRANVTITGDLILTGLVDGRDVSVDGIKLDGIESAADVTDAVNVDAAGAVMNTDVDAKGDLFVATGIDTLVRLPIGANDQVLAANSGQPEGVKWRTMGELLQGSNTQLVYLKVDQLAGMNVFTFDETDLLVGVATKLKFRDSAIHISSPTDGNLEIVADVLTKIIGAAEITGQLDAADVRINGKIIDCPGAGDDLTVRGNTTGQVIIGRDGDFDIFQAIKRRFGPAQALKATLGSASLPFAEAFIHGLLDANVVGVRGRYKAANFSDPPKDSELDTELGTPAALGGGYKAVIEATTGGKRWVVATDGTGWYHSTAMTLATG